MRHIRVLVCQVDDDTPDLMSELACFDLATPAVATLQPETALDMLEATTQEIGMTILRHLLHAQWDTIDAVLVAQHCAQVAPAVVQLDGHETVTVASRFGLLHLARQVCVDPPTQSHTLPGNAVLPPHAGIIITRGLQEWSCLLPQDLSFEPVARLLGWQTQEDKVLCATIGGIKVAEGPQAFLLGCACGPAEEFIKDLIEHVERIVLGGGFQDTSKG